MTKKKTTVAARVSKKGGRFLRLTPAEVERGSTRFAKGEIAKRKKASMKRKKK